MRAVVAIVGVVLVLSGCGPRGTSRVAALPGSRVAVVVLENHGPAAVLRHGWLARSARAGGRALEAIGEAHPAQPYFVMLTGDERPLSDAQAVARPRKAANLLGQLDRHHIAWRAYMGGMPGPCFGRRSGRDVVGRYAKRHDPFLFLASIADHPADCRADVVPETRLRSDIARGRITRFTWVSPDLCQDMHSCPVAAGQRWMAGTLPPLLRSLGPRGLLFVVADERSPAGSGGGRIPLVALGGDVRPHSLDRVRVDHRAMLATIEDLLGLGRLRTVRDAPTLQPLLKR